ncbi:MAG: Asp-tRNA(Asn)/Glu-tRNA(Gln) amidotransferase subunit GatB [Lentisphaerae bacterium]|nr:Asp-tRNA(Asn)/Glu-tRNA(Gln) amidotransferase subunit GatB [Lentisphaerota bacterium]
MKYDVVIGLEVHVQLKTVSKMFCGCGTQAGAEPNTQICPVCLGYPGTLPAINGEAVRLGAIAGMLLDSEIARCSKFDRKSYFYPDVSKNYQITQYPHPICIGGHLDITVGGAARRIGITRIHLEEDVAKSVHHATFSGVDFNRCGVALIELVTEPELRAPAEAVAFLQALRQTLVYAEVGECNLEQGNMRCDANISLRPAGAERLGTKIEIKNLNSFKAVQAALEHEIVRQADLLNAGGVILQETRRWNADAGVTESMRGKENAHDYRYFPDPDLLPVVLSAEQIAEWRATLPERPAARRARLAAEYGLPPYDAEVLAAERPVADFFEAVARRCGNGKAASNWIMTEVLRLLAESGTGIEACALTPEALGDLIALVGRGTINQPTAKALLPELFSRGGDPAALVRARGLGQVGDAHVIAEWVETALADNPGPVADYLAGKQAAAGYLVGQVMKLSRGKADPKQVGALVARGLEARRGGESGSGAAQAPGVVL